MKAVSFNKHDAKPSNPVLVIILAIVTYHGLASCLLNETAFTNHLNVLFRVDIEVEVGLAWSSDTRKFNISIQVVNDTTSNNMEYGNGVWWR